MTDFNDQEVSLRKVILERANQVIVLADSSKIGVRAFSVIGDISRIDVLVTDDRIHPDTKEALEAIGIEVLIAKLEVFGDSSSR